MIIKSLIDNICYDDNLEAEHGLSMYIEANGYKILFDSGQSDMFIRNAKKMNIDLEDVDFMVLSHSHYDHGGGLKYFMEINSKALIYVNEGCFSPCYSLRKNDEMVYIGLDDSLKNNPRIIYTNEFYKINDNMILFSKVSNKESSLITNKRLFKKINGQFINDDFDHEHDFLIKENNKTYLFVGCAHSGIINILNKYQELFNEEPDYVIGGFHLYSRSLPIDITKDLTDEIGHKLLKYHTMFYTGHCTGLVPYEHLKTILKDHISYLSVGTTLNI